MTNASRTSSSWHEREDIVERWIEDSRTVKEKEPGAQEWLSCEKKNVLWYRSMNSSGQ